MVHLDPQRASSTRAALSFLSYDQASAGWHRGRSGPGLPTVTAAAEPYGSKVEFLGMNVTIHQTPARVRRIDAKGTVVYTGFGGKQDFEQALKGTAGL